eukprot:2161168-Rhodomonas_salina.2
MFEASRPSALLRIEGYCCACGCCSCCPPLCHVFTGCRAYACACACGCGGICWYAAAPRLGAWSSGAGAAAVAGGSASLEAAAAPPAARTRRSSAQAPSPGPTLVRTGRTPRAHTCSQQRPPASEPRCPSAVAVRVIWSSALRVRRWLTALTSHPARPPGCAARPAACSPAAASAAAAAWPAGSPNTPRRSGPGGVTGSLTAAVAGGGQAARAAAAARTWPTAPRSAGARLAAGSAAEHTPRSAAAAAAAAAGVLAATVAKVLLAGASVRMGPRMPQPEHSSAVAVAAAVAAASVAASAAAAAAGCCTPCRAQHWTASATS